MAKRGLVWKRRIGHFFRHFPGHRARSVVLIYHAVGSGPHSLPTRRFQEQLDWLAQNARVISIDALLAVKNPAGLQVALTFDDGYACTTRTVAPLLRRAGMPATVFLNTSCIGETKATASDPERGHTPGEEFLIWPEVLGLRDIGWTIGSHGADHRDLTRLPDAEVYLQLRHSKATVEARLGTECLQFAYTWGNHNARVRAAVADCGYASAFAGVHGPVLPSSNRYAIPRIDIRSEYELEDFVAVLNGDWDYLGLVQRARRLLQ